VLTSKRGEQMQPPTTIRKNKILKAVVEAYIKSGEPVGSKSLLNTLDFPVSSATVRNEMSELSEMGLLLQPHTSAGRIPSQEGIRFYVNKLMEKQPLSSSKRAVIYDALSYADDPEKLLKITVNTLADLTGAAVTATTPASDNARIHRLKFVQTGRQTCMVVVIASTGLVKTRLFKCDYVVTDEIIRVYETLFNKSLEGMPVKSITPAFVQTLAVEMGDLALLVPGALAAIMSACSEIGGFSSTSAGRANVLSGELDSNTLEGLIKLLHSSEAIEALIIGIGNRKIVVGDEAGIPALNEMSVINEPYNIDTSCSGIISAITPLCCDYAYIVSVLEYAGECVSKLLKQMLSIEDI